MLYRIQSTALGQSGNSLLILPNATITVRDANGDLARLYADPDEITEIDNPALSDAAGGYDFYVEYGDYYDITVALNGQSVDDRIYPIDMGLGARVDAAAATATEQAGIATTKAGEANTSAGLSQAWAESPTAPGDPGTKSAKTWAGEAADDATAAAASAADAALFSSPQFPTKADMALYESAEVGDVATVQDGANGQSEDYDWIAGSTLTADGALVVDGVGGQWVNTRYQKPNIEGVVPYYNYAAPSSKTLDNTASIQAALNDTGEVIIPEGQWRVDGTILMGNNTAIRLNQGAWLARTTDTTNTAPVVHIKGNTADLTGSGRNSLVRSFNNAPDGVVKMGQDSMTVGNYDVLYSSIRNIAIYGSTSLGRTSGPADVGLYMPCVASGGNANYFNTVQGVLFAQLNVGSKLEGNSNAHIMTNLQFLRMGGNNIPGMDNAGLWLLGAKENMASHMFFNFCPTLRCIVLENSALGALPQLNQVTNWVAEPDTGGTGSGTSRGVVIVSCGVGNYIQGNGVGTANDFSGTGWYGDNRRNTFVDSNIHESGTSLTIRRPSPSIVLNGNDVEGGKSTIFGLGNPATPILTFRANGTGGDDTMWEMVGNGAFRPADNNLRDIGQSVRQVRNLYLGTSVRINDTKVLGAQGAAVTNTNVTATSGALPATSGSTIIADAANPTPQELLKLIMEERAKSETLRSRVRAHGLIAT